MFEEKVITFFGNISLCSRCFGFVSDQNNNCGDEKGRFWIKFGSPSCSLLLVKIVACITFFLNIEKMTRIKGSSLTR